MEKVKTKENAPYNVIIFNNGGVVNVYQKEEKTTKNDIKPYEKHKKSAIYVQKTLEKYYISEKRVNKAQNIADCGTFLKFRQWNDIAETQRLIGANFCKHPLCPLCAWRKHIKDSETIKKAIENISPNDFLYHLVLTVPNIKKISFERLTEIKAQAVKFIKKQMKLNDYLTSYEITWSKKTGYHPHVHAIVASDQQIETDIENISKLRNEWGKCIKSPYGYAIMALYPVTDRQSAAEELTKYLCKPMKRNERMPEKVIMEIAKTTKGIRRFSAGGEIKKAINASKRSIEEENNEEMQRLTDYEYIDRMFAWFGEEYKEIEP